jgi:beta-N-acetylhexosaminidase
MLFRPIIIRGVLAVALAAAVGGSTEVSAAAAAAPAGGSGADARARAALAAMTLPERVGQLFVSAVFGDSATTTAPADVAANQAAYGADAPNGAAVLAKFHLGGVIYFTSSRNLANPQQIAALSNGLQRAAVAAGGVPVQISADQEGGIVNRIGAPAAVSPGNMAIAATGNPANAYRAAAVSGAELRAMGINLDDAPVVDVNTNPHNSADGPRAFSDRTAVVSAFGAAAVAGYQRAGVGAQAKHFPGLGDTTVNTDNGVAVTDETRQQILTTHLPPFRAAIAAGVKSIMVGHVIAPALDASRTPASLSRPIVTGLLRDGLHYDGVVATDALNAGALADRPGSQVVLDAINAGVDELLLPPDLPGAVQAVLDAVNAGTISRARIDQSALRILRMKAQLGLFTDPYTTPDRVSATVGTPAHLQTMAGLARQSITLLRNELGLLPLAPNPATRALVTGWGVATTQALATGLAAAGLTTARLWTGSPDPQLIDQAVTAANSADVTVVTTNNVWADASQRSLVEALLGTGRPVVVVSVAGPYDIASFPAAPSYLAAYDFQPVSTTALVNTLVGTAPAGRLPVTIRTPAGDQILFGYGAGIDYDPH